MNLSETNKFNMPTLAERALLVRLSRSVYQPYAFDQGATLKVEIDTGVRKAGRFNKRLLLDCHQLTDTNAAFNDVYQYHMRNSAPWLDSGARIIPSETYFDYSVAIKELIAEANRKADALAKAWPQLVADDLARLGPLGNPQDYPSDIRGKYAVSVKFMPIPQSTDFRVAISDEDRESLNKAIAEAEDGVTKHLLAEMLEPVKKAVDKLSIPIGDQGAIFRDSLLTNLTEVAQRASKLNIMGDPVVREMVESINKAVGGYAQAPHVLRENDGARSDAKDKLADVMSKMGAFFAPTN